MVLSFIWLHQRAYHGLLDQEPGYQPLFDVQNGSKSDSAVVQQSTCNKDARSMLWYVQPGDWPGVFKVRNFNSERCLDVRGGSRAEDAQLQQFRCTRSTWRRTLAKNTSSSGWI
jgi:hypothetical protein